MTTTQHETTDNAKNILGVQVLGLDELSSFTKEQHTAASIRFGLNYTQEACHKASTDSGWWTDLKTGLPLDVNPLVPEKLCLVHSEISEALEGHRKGMQDEKLTHRLAVEVELADAIIRIMDLAGALNLDIGGAVVEKMAYNANRADHKIANRLADGGKKY